jgi:hypothetical protein
VQSREVEEVAGELEQVDPAEVRRAAKREQAGILFADAVKMVKAAPALAKPPTPPAA